MYILRFEELVEGALPREETTVRQLKELDKISKKTDIGRRISDMNKQGANIQYIRNPVDSIESYEDYMRKAKPEKVVKSKSK